MGAFDCAEQEHVLAKVKADWEAVTEGGSQAGPSTRAAVEGQRAEQARREAATRGNGPITQYLAGLLTMGDLIEGLQEVVRANPAHLCWCHELATYRVTIDIALVYENTVLTYNSSGETCVFMCQLHAALASGSAERIEV